MAQDLIVGGIQRAARAGSTLIVREPATGEVLAEVAAAGPIDVTEAVDLAHRAFEEGTWSRLAPTGRGRVLARVAALLRDEADALADLEARNGGKPRADALWEVEAAAGTFEYYAGAADKLLGEVVPAADPGLTVVLREPIGVVGLIVPWNFPLLIASWKVAPALACGNPIVLKPSELTPLTALALGRLLVDAGVPPSCVSVLPGLGPVAGEALVADERVAKISFTGSVATAVSIVRTSAPNIPRVTLELGGKSACIVFADADLSRCVSETPMAVFGNAGQDCCARSRVLVERTVYDEVVAGFAARASSLQVGGPFDVGVEMGPLISSQQRDRVAGMVKAGQGEGAQVVTGGDIPAGYQGGGYFYAPTVLAGVDNAMSVAQEEIFGPVVCLIPFDTEEEAVRLTNESVYGLSGSVWTGDAGRAIRMANRVRAGVLSVNSNRSVRTQGPFGGYKRSGTGRELGMHAMQSYTEVKQVYFADTERSPA